ncbi:hypothetical protein KI387_002796, partial [Taxus chinensis]
FVVAANVIGCAYSFIRIIHGFMGLVSGGSGYYLSFIFDQVMAYIVLSSASAGVACIMLNRELLQGTVLYDCSCETVFEVCISFCD